MSINAVELRPRSVLEVLGLSFDLYRKNFPLFIGIAAVVMVPSLLLTSLSQLLPLVQVAIAPASFGNADASSEFGMAFVGLTTATYCLSAIALVLGVFWPWMEGALTFNVIERVLGREPGLRQSYRETRPRWGGLWGSNLLAQLGINAPLIVIYIAFFFLFFIAGIASVAGSSDDNSGAALFAGVLALLCVPVLIAGFLLMIVLAIIWVFRAPAIVGEGVDGVSALGRSHALAKGHRWRLFGRYALLGLVEFVLIGLPVLLVSVFVALIAFPNLDTSAGIDRAVLPGFTLLSVVGVAVSFFGALLLTPLRIIYTAINYIDLRTRKENLALVVAGLPPEPAPAVPAAVAAPVVPALITSTEPASAPATAPVVAPEAPAKIGIGIPANVDMNTLSPGQRIGVLFNRIRNEGASVELLNELGMAYMEIGDTGGSMDAFTRARELDPNDADVAYNLMLLNMQRKDTNGAKAMMREYLRLETNAADAERVRNDPRFKDVLPEQS